MNGCVAELLAFLSKPFCGAVAIGCGAVAIGSPPQLVSCMGLGWFSEGCEDSFGVGILDG